LDSGLRYQICCKASGWLLVELVWIERFPFIFVAHRHGVDASRRVRFENASARPIALELAPMLTI
jgi:hypothetical protein